MSNVVNPAVLHPSELFDGKSILLSGTTGFLGKVVMSLLLTRYPNIRKIYTLIRPGISESASQRFAKSVATSPALQPLSQKYGDGLEAFLADKVRPIAGNITQEHCGIPADELALLEREGVDVIINSAGLVDFDPAVDQALSINAIGAMHVVKLAQRLNAALVHVSTCFVAGAQHGNIREDAPIVNHTPQPSSVPFDYKREITRLSDVAREVRSRADDPLVQAEWRASLASQNLDAAALRMAVLRKRKIWLAEELRRVGMERAKFWGWTNTYTFTKSLGEQVIADAALNQGLRASIVRPSIVESALHFPFPGWNEGLTTTAPLILLARSGLPQFPMAEDLLLDVIPCDMVATMIIAATAATLDKAPPPLVVQASTGDVNPLTIRQAVELTGFSVRTWARVRNDGSVLGKWLQHHEMLPTPREVYDRYSIPAYKRTAKALGDWLDKATALKQWQVTSKLRHLIAEVEKRSSRTETILAMFMPFVAEQKYVFRADQARHLWARLPAAEQAGLYYAPTSYVWRDYWLKVHTPGLDKWVFPELDKNNKPAAANSNAGLVLPPAVAQTGKRLLGLAQRQFFTSVMDTEVTGAEYIPQEGGFIIAANHASHLDAGLVKTALGPIGENMAALAAKDYFFASKIRRIYFENFTNLLPMERQGALKESLRRALAVLEQGAPLLLFPEGTRSNNGQMMPFKPSVGFLALAANCPILPVYLTGTFEAMPKGSMLLPKQRRLGVHFGPPIHLDTLQPALAARRRAQAYRIITMVTELAVWKLRAGENYDVAQLLHEVLARRLDVD